MCELEGDDERMMSVSVRVILMLYLHRNTPPNSSELQLIRRAISKCVSYGERKEMEEDLTYVIGVKLGEPC